MKSVFLLPLFLVLCDSVNIIDEYDEKYREKEREWWESALFYQIYLRSFSDSNGDGIGDLNGIKLKLGYLKELGVDAIWLSSIYQSPMYDIGYDISDYYSIQDEYGSMEDFNHLVKKAEKMDIKIILELVPNHISNESSWFQEALKGSEKYMDFFIWEDGISDDKGQLQPPNNWLNHYQGSAWEYRDEVGKFYFHQFLVGEPDLNYRNPNVVREMKDIIRFWLNMGVAGFRINAVDSLFEADKGVYGGKYPNEPLSGKVDADAGSYDSLSHIYTKELNETYYMVYYWREVFDEIRLKDGLPRVMMTEAYSSIKNVVNYFGKGNKNGAQIPINFDLITDVNALSSAADIKCSIDKFLTYKPINQNANWIVGNHDTSRMATRFGSSLVDGINMILLLLPGIAVTYMGEEIGMIDGYVSWEDSVDPAGCNTIDPLNYFKKSRDPERTPFQWSSEKNAGFSVGDKTWLPIADGYETLNVETQKAAEKSHLKVYKDLAELRRKKVFKYGRYESIALNDDVFAFNRWFKGESYVIVVNLKNTEHTVRLDYFEHVHNRIRVEISSVDSTKRKGEHFTAYNVPIEAKEAIVFRV